MRGRSSPNPSVPTFMTIIDPVVIGILFASHFVAVFVCFISSCLSDLQTSFLATRVAYGNITASVYYPHMPIYRLLFVCLFVCLLAFVIVCVCTVVDFSDEDKASGVKFCTVVHRRSGQAISQFGELCSLKSPKSADESASARTEL